VISFELKKVILDALDLADFAIEDATVAPQVPGWDSLAHMQVIAAVERAFNVRFRTLEVMRLKNVGDLQALLGKKVAHRG
jgi:acyl carrier protein